MSDTEISIKAPVRSSLYKLNKSKATKAKLMPGHWALYDQILTKVREDGLVDGATLPTGLSELYDDLEAFEILVPAPLTHKDWQKIKSQFESQVLDADNSSGEEPAGGDLQEADLDFLD